MSLLFWGCLPFILPQALYVRATAPRTGPAPGPREGLVGDSNPLKLLAIGDSIIAGVGASALSNALVGRTASALSESLGQAVAWEALGQNGYRSEDILTELVPKLPQETADFVIVSVGVNDVTKLTTVSRWRRNIEALADELRWHSPDATIAFAGLPPLHEFPLLPQPMRALFGTRARTLDAALEDVVGRIDGAVRLPLNFDANPEFFSADGYHPSEAGYEIFGREMAATLAATFN